MSGQKSSAADVLVDVGDDADILATDLSRSGQDDDTSEEERSSGADQGANGSAPKGDGQGQDWQAKYRAERSRKLEAQRKAREIEERHAAFIQGTEAKLTDIQRQTAGLTAIQVGRRVADFERAVAAAEHALTAAYETSDPRQITQAQKEMNAAQIAFDRARSDAEAYGVEFKKQTEPVKIPMPAASPEAPDPEQVRLRDEWMGQNKWFDLKSTDPKIRQASVDAFRHSQDLHRRGLDPTDPDHWRQITERIRKLEPDLVGDGQQQDDPPPRRQPPRQQGGEQVRAPQSGRTTNQGRDTPASMKDYRFSGYEISSWKAAGYDVVNKPEDRQRALKSIERTQRRRS